MMEGRKLMLIEHVKSHSPVTCPLHALAAIEPDTTIEPIDGGWSATWPFGGRVVFRQTLGSVEQIDLSILATDGNVNTKIRIEAAGDADSAGYWFPFTPLLDLLGDATTVITADRVKQALLVTVARVRELLTKVVLHNDDAAILEQTPVAVMAADYIRRQVPSRPELLLSCAYPYELFIGHCDEPITLGELPPGLTQIGEAALVTVTPGPITSWWMRPARLMFKGSLKGMGAKRLGAAKARLIAASLTLAQIDQLDVFAASLAEDFAWLDDGNDYD
jgi:hypothetical protein